MSFHRGVIVLGLLLALGAPVGGQERPGLPVLQVYLVGPEPPDMGSVARHINDLAAVDLGAQVRWTFLGWDKWDQKYNLALASGEPISLIYTANWANYSSYARKGAFLALDAVLPQAAPRLWGSLTAAQWDEARVGGRIYTVPADWKEYQTNGIAYREDLAERWGLSLPLKTLDAVERYLLAAKRADPNALPYAATYEDLMQIQDAFLGPFDQVIRGTFLGYFLVADTAGRLVEWTSTPEFRRYAQTMQRWRQAGFWSPDILSNKVASQEAFRQGRNAAASANPGKIDVLYRMVAPVHPDWRIGAFVYAVARGRVYPNPGIGNGMAVPRSSPDPALSLRLLERLRTDPRYYQATTYGLQGRHWVPGPAGGARPVPSSGFWYQAMQPWGWHVDGQELPADGSWPGYPALTTQLEKLAVHDPFATFAFDSRPVAAPVAALNQVANQYLLPLYTGMAGDVDAAIAVVRVKLREAGLESLRREMQGQLDAYRADARSGSR